MMPWFLWKGKNSLSDFGLWINKLPRRVRPEERHEEIEIPGRAGSLIMLEGEDVYSSYAAEMTVWARNTLNMDAIIEWLRGSDELVLSTDIDKARSARIVGEVSFERVGNNLQQAVIPFLFQPFRKSRFPDGDRRSFTASSQTLYNPGDVASKPVVAITRNGGITITIDGQTMAFHSVGGTIYVDCDAQLIKAHTDDYSSSRYYAYGDYAIFTEDNEEVLYRFTDAGTGSALVSGGKRKKITDWDGNEFDYIWQGWFSGDFWRIPKGSFTITRDNSATIVIDPNWRWL